MKENVQKFFDLYESDAALRERVAEAEANYPGSLEIREALVEDVLIPIATQLGLPFSVKDLRAYETRVKMKNIKPDAPIPEDEPIDENPISYWLLDRGWENDEDIFKRKEQ